MSVLLLAMQARTILFKWTALILFPLSSLSYLGWFDKGAWFMFVPRGGGVAHPESLRGLYWDEGLNELPSDHFASTQVSHLAADCRVARAYVISVEVVGLSKIKVVRSGPTLPRAARYESLWK